MVGDQVAVLSSSQWRWEPWFTLEAGGFEEQGTPGPGSGALPERDPWNSQARRPCEQWKECHQRWMLKGASVAPVNDGECGCMSQTRSEGLGPIPWVSPSAVLTVFTRKNQQKVNVRGVSRGQGGEQSGGRAVWGRDRAGRGFGSVCQVLRPLSSFPSPLSFPVGCLPAALPTGGGRAPITGHRTWGWPQRPALLGFSSPLLSLLGALVRRREG